MYFDSEAIQLKIDHFSGSEEYKNEDSIDEFIDKYFKEAYSRHQVYQ